MLSEARSIVAKRQFLIGRNEVIALPKVGCWWRSDVRSYAILIKVDFQRAHQRWPGSR
jgi:hypothetical protein